MAYGIATWSRTPDTWEHEYNLITPTHKTLILSNGTYIKLDLSGWKTVSTTLPDQLGFEEHGMEDLSVLDRAVQPTLDSPHTMLDDGALGDGKVFKSTVDLKKYFDLRKLALKQHTN